MSLISYNGKPITHNGAVLTHLPKPSTLASGSSWYKGTTAKSTITEIQIVDSYTPAGTVTEQWNADVNNDGSIKAYVEGTKLTIAGNGAGKIMANADSAKAFFDFSTATSISGMGLLDTSQVTAMSGMFANCNALTGLDLSNFDTSKVTVMGWMFYECMALTKIYVSNLWSTASVLIEIDGVMDLTPQSGMFQNCTSLVGAVPYDSTKPDIFMANYTTGYLTYKAYP